MTQQELNYYRSAAAIGLIPDEENPIFLFSSANKDILMDIISGKIDAIQLARLELLARGIDEKNGRWTGWKDAQERESALMVRA